MAVGKVLACRLLGQLDKVLQLWPEVRLDIQQALARQHHRGACAFQSARLFVHRGTGIADVLGKRQFMYPPTTQVDHRAAAQ
ncbi:hypothetical protein D3C78_777970 [compost metagenome]